MTDSFKTQEKILYRQLRLNSNRNMNNAMGESGGITMEDTHDHQVETWPDESYEDEIMEVKQMDNDFVEVVLSKAAYCRFARKCCHRWDCEDGMCPAQVIVLR